MDVYTLPLAEPQHLQELRELQPAKKGKTMTKPEAKELTAWQDPRIIGATASQTAQIVDENKPHHEAGVTEALCCIVTAVHRAAEAMEQTNRDLAELCDFVREFLPPADKGV